MGRAGRHAQARAFDEAGAIGQRHRERLGHGHVLRAGAVRAAALRVPQPDPLADPALVDPGTDRLDHAGAIAVGNDARIAEGLVAPAGAPLGVGGVDAGRVHPDQDLAGAGRRPRHITNADHVARRPGRLVPGSPHGPAHAMARSTRRVASPSAATRRFWPRTSCALAKPTVAAPC